MWLCEDKLKRKTAHFWLLSASQTRACLSSLIERLSYDLENVFAICFTDQCLAKLKQSFFLFPLRKLLIWAVNSSIAQSHYYISNDVKAKLSRKFHGEMTLFASAFAKPMTIRARLFLFDKPIKCFAFLFTFCFCVYFSRSYESRSIARAPHPSSPSLNPSTCPPKFTQLPIHFRSMK